MSRSIKGNIKHLTGNLIASWICNFTVSALINFICCFPLSGNNQVTQAFRMMITRYFASSSLISFSLNLPFSLCILQLQLLWLRSVWLRPRNFAVGKRADSDKAGEIGGVNHEPPPAAWLRFTNLTGCWHTERHSVDVCSVFCLWSFCDFHKSAEPNFILLQVFSLICFQWL